MTQTMHDRPIRPAAAGRAGPPVAVAIRAGGDGRGRALLEREAALAALAAAVRSAAGGRGSAVLVTGEAGIGKTTWCASSSSAPPAG